MDYAYRYSGIKQRLNLQSISNFIYSGSTLNYIDKNNYKVREQLAYNNLQKAINDICGDEHNEELEQIINEYFYTFDQIYFNMGMKSGATLIVNLTKNFDNDWMTNEYKKRVLK